MKKKLKGKKLREAISLDDIQNRISQAIRERYGENTWVRRVFPDGYAIYEVDDKLFKVSFAIDEDLNVTLGEDAMEVMLDEQYIPIRESFRLVEAKNDEGTEWEVVLIKAGRSGNNFTYPIEVLEDAIPLFEGVRAFAVSDAVHLDDKEKIKKDTHNIVGWFSEVRRVSNELRAKFNIVESADWLIKTMRSAWKKGKKDIVGFSIDALGKAAMKQLDGSLTYMVETIEYVLSVDVVVDPAAGGRILKLVASNSNMPGHSGTFLGEELEMLEKLLKLLEAKRPDLYAKINKDSITEDEVMKLLESAVPKEDVLGELKKLKEAASSKKPDPEGGQKKTKDPDAVDTMLKESQKKLDDAVATIQKQTKLTECATTLKESVGGSGLPRISQDRITKRFKSKVFETPELDDIIKDEKEFLSKLSESGKVRGFGDTIEVGEEQKEKHEHALDGFFAGQNVEKIQRFRTLREAYGNIMGNPGVDASVIFKESYPMALAESPVIRRMAEALTTSSWAQILGDSIARRMLAEYRIPGLDSWRKIVSDVVPVSDFRTQRRMRMGGYGTLAAVGQGDNYENVTSPTDEEATYVVSKRGGIESLTLEMVANDDVGSIRRIPRALARAAAQTLYRFVFDFIKDNAAIYDAVALFHANHGNLGSAALSHGEFFNRRVAMRDQAAYNNSTEVLGLIAQLLLIPAELEDLAFQLSKSEKKIGGNTNERNLFQAAFEYLVIDYWTDANDWAMVANPLDVPTIEIGFFEGREEPELFVQDMQNVGSMFDADKITYKIRHVYGGDVMDHRGFQKNVVA